MSYTRQQARGSDAPVRVLFFVIGVAVATLLPYLSILLKSRGFDPQTIGLVLGSMALAGVVANPLWGMAADRRIGSGGVLVVASVLAATTAIAILLVDGHLVVGLILITCLGIFHGPVVALGDAIALEDLDHSSRHVYGRIRLWSSAGYALSIVIFGIVYQSIDVELALPFYAIAILGLAFSARGFRTGTIGVKETRELRFLSLITPKFAGFLLIVLLVDSAQAAAWGFIPLRIVGVGGTIALVGLAAAIEATSEIPAMRLGPWLAEHLTARVIVGIAGAFYVAAYLAWSLSSAIWVLVLLRTLSGVGFGIFYVASVLLTDTLAPAGLRATAQQTMQAVGWGISPLIGGAVGGALYAHLGAPSMFFVAALTVGSGIVLAWATLGRTTSLQTRSG